MAAAVAALDGRTERARPHSHKALSEDVDYRSFHIRSLVVRRILGDGRRPAADRPKLMTR